MSEAGDWGRLRGFKFDTSRYLKLKPLAQLKNEKNMPRVNISFWGVFKNGKIHDVCRSMAAAKRMMNFRRTTNKDQWCIATVQVIYD